MYYNTQTICDWYPIYAKQKIVKQYFLLEQLYELDPMAQFHGSAYRKQGTGVCRSREFCAYLILAGISRFSCEYSFWGCVLQVRI